MRVIKKNDVEIVKCPICKTVIDDGTHGFFEMNPCKHMQFYGVTSYTYESPIVAVDRINATKSLQTNVGADTFLEIVKSNIKKKKWEKHYVIHFNETYLGGCGFIYYIAVYKRDKKYA
jgi:hypothetical protein